MCDTNKIIQSCKAGSTFAAQRLIEKHKTLLYRLTVRLTKDKYDAEDLFQDTWVKVFSKLDTFDQNQSFDNWLYTICLNTYRDQYSKKKRWLNVIRDFFDNEQKERAQQRVRAEGPSIEEQVTISEDEQRLKRNLEKLDDRFRIAIILYYFNDLSYQDIAQILNIPIGTAKSRLSLGKKKLKELIEEDEQNG